MSARFLYDSFLDMDAEVNACTDNTESTPVMGEPKLVVTAAKHPG